MDYNLVSGDNHIDLTYCPPDLWSSQVPGKWRLLVPRVEELEDGLHWFIEGRDVGMWNGVGPGFNSFVRGSLALVDKMYDLGFYTGHHREATPRPTTPELRVEDLDKDGVDAEIVYGILGANNLIADGEMRGWVYQVYNDWVADFARRADPHRVFPLAAVPNHDPQAAAAEIRRCAKMGLKGGDFPLNRAAYPLVQRSGTRPGKRPRNVNSPCRSTPPALGASASPIARRQRRSISWSGVFSAPQCSSWTVWRYW